MIDWTAPPDKLSSPEAGGLHLWLIDLSTVEGVNTKVLSSDENARAERLSSKKLRERNLASSTAMREILAGYLDTHPRLIEFSIGVHGKPALRAPESRLEFNLTHSEDLALFALSCDCPVGVDIEVIRGRKHLLRIARRMFGDDVYQSLLELSDEEQTHCFLQHWTCFESKVKTLGSTLFSGSEAMDGITAVNFRPVESAIAAIAMPADVPPRSIWSTFRWYAGPLSQLGE